MTLAPGSRLGVYAVTELIGHGGMGAVYRAHDTRLGRDVAIKVLPEAFIADPDRAARFELEARALASLNHPHIGAIYGLEEATRTNNTTVTALVLELVDGPSLADRIFAGPHRCRRHSASPERSPMRSKPRMKMASSTAI